MRSDLVIAATKYVPNRYLLTRLAAKAARKLHKPGTRIQETMNHAFLLFNRTDPMPRALESNCTLCGLPAMTEYREVSDFNSSKSLQSYPLPAVSANERDVAKRSIARVRRVMAKGPTFPTDEERTSRWI